MVEKCFHRTAQSDVGMPHTHAPILPQRGTNTMKKLGIILLALLMLTLLLPGAMAADATTVRIGSAWLTDGQYLASYGTEPTTTQPAPGGYAHFADGVLTLNGFDFDNYKQSGSTPGVIYADGDLKVVLQDTSEVISAGIADGYTGVTAALYVTGNLTIESQKYGNVYFHNRKDTGASTRYGIYAGGTLEIQGDGTVTASAGPTKAGGSIGIFSKGDMTLACNNINAVGGDAGTDEGHYSYGISGPNITITRGTITAIAGKAATSVGISANHNSVVSPYTEGDLHISGKFTVVEATGGNDSGVSVGISAGDLVQVDDGEVTAKGGSAYRISRGIGHNSYNKLVVNGGQVAAMGGYSSHNTSCGYEGRSVTQTGGELLLAGSSDDNGYAVSNSSETPITVSGGTFVAAGGQYALYSLPTVVNYTGYGVWVSTDFAPKNPDVYDGETNPEKYKYLEIGKAEFVNVYVRADYDRRGTVTGGGRYMKGSFVTVEATPLNGSEFISWTKNGTAGTVLNTNDTYTFKAESDITLYANFNPAMHQVKLTNARFSVDSTFTAKQFEVATNVTVSADSKLSEGYIFDRWEVDGITLTEEQETYSTLDFLMPASDVTVTALYRNANDHSHAPCGDPTCTDSTHPSHSTVDYKPLNLNDTLTLQDGNNYYYLTTDIYPEQTISISSGQTLYLCLHGNDVIGNFEYSGNSVLTVSDSGKLILCDCKGGGRITTQKYGRGIMAGGISNDRTYTGSVEMYGGNITGNTTGEKTNYDTYFYHGGGVYLSNGMSFTMYGGSITNNTAANSTNGGGVIVASGATFTMHGGTISGNTAYDGGGIYVDYRNGDAQLVITGGTITGNTASNYGGGVYVNSSAPGNVADMLMTGGAITNNTSYSRGGGVYNDHGNVQISNATITGNKATSDSSSGGGIYNFSGYLDLKDTTITGNKASQGGGIYYYCYGANSDHINVSGNVTVNNNTNLYNRANNVYLESDSYLTVTGHLTGDLRVYTQDIPDQNKPVRYLKSTSGHTVDKDDLDHTTSDRTGTYFTKNIDRENYGIFGKVQYTVTVTNDGNGTATANLTLAENGTAITLTATPKDGYNFKEWQVVSGGVTVADNKFTMGTADVEIKAVFEAIHTCGNPMLVAGKIAKCTEDGWKSYYQCSCGKLYEDEACEVEISSLDAWKSDDGKIPGGHTYGELIPAAEAIHTQDVLKAPVAAHYFCDVCNTYFTENMVNTTLEALTGEVPQHVYGEWNNTDVDKHWKECTCGLKSGEGEHVFANDQDTDCDTCGYVRTVHQHTFADGWAFDETNHWHAATCEHQEMTSGLEAHHGGTATCTVQAVCEDCGQPYGAPASHTYGDLIPATEAVHTQTELKAAVAAHYFCNVCNTYFTENMVETTLDALTGTTPEHDQSSWVNTDPDQHWNKCSICGLEHNNKSIHVFDNDQDTTCDTCGYRRDVHLCHGTLVDGQAATCTVDGWKSHYQCSCGKQYADEACTVEIADLDAWKSGDGKIPAGHTFSETFTHNDTHHWKECTCKAKSEEGAHVFDNDQDATCDTCGYTREVAVQTFTVTFNANGGDGSMQAQTFTAGESKALTANAFTKANHTFTGWNTLADGSGMSFSDGQLVTVNGDVTLYAQWQAQEAPKPIDPKPDTNPLVIIRHPADQIVTPGETAVFSVLASGDGLTYQWYINRNDGRGWVKLPGSDGTAHETSAAALAHDGFQYACEVRDAYGNSARSQVAVLYVAAQPEIPPTGDEAHIGLLCALLLLSCAGGLLLARSRKRLPN